MTALLLLGVAVLGVLATAMLRAAGMSVSWWRIPVGAVLAALLGTTVAPLVARLRRAGPPRATVTVALRWPDADRSGRRWRHGSVLASPGRLEFAEVRGGRLLRLSPVELVVTSVAPGDRAVGVRESWSVAAQLRVVELLVDGARVELATAPADLDRLRDELAV